MEGVSGMLLSIQLSCVTFDISATEFSYPVRRRQFHRSAIRSDDMDRTPTGLLRIFQTRFPFGDAAPSHHHTLSTPLIEESRSQAAPFSQEPIGIDGQWF